jgi:lipoic acid synthetase
MGGVTVSFGGQVPESKPVLPSWIRKRRIRLSELHEIKRTMRSGGLHTVCEEARCPNRSECFSHGTATFLINGRICTRNCRYCSIAQGRPDPVDPDEPRQLLEAARSMNLRHVVITAVDRDDLDDGGAAGFVDSIRALREGMDPAPTIEVLTPDFRGDMALVDRIIEAGPEVYNHNVETVPRLYRSVRRSGRYHWAMEVLRRVAERAPSMLRKSGLMVGLGETVEEIHQVMEELAQAGCQVVTVGQYLQPTGDQVPVERYWHPDEFTELEHFGRELGLKVFAGPFVRSSYRAEEAFLRVADGPAASAQRLPVVG